MRADKNVLLIIILAALLVRVPNINVTLAGDEIDTVGPARNFLAAGETYQYQLCDGTEYFNNTHPPFRIAFYSLWASIFGISDIAMRLVPLIFGVGTILLIYLFGKELYSKKAGLAAAAIAALSRYHIYTSQIVTNDNTLFLFLFLASMYFFVLYKKRDDVKYAAISGAFIVASLYAKIAFFVLVPSLLIFSYFYGRKKLKQDVAIIAASFAAFLASLYCISILAGDPSIFWGPLNVLPATAGSSAASSLATKAFYAVTIMWQLTPFLALLSVIALFKMKRDKTFWFLASWIILPFAAFMAGGGDVQRYFAVSIPAVFLLIGRYLENIEIKDKYLAASAAALIVIAAATGLNDLMGYYNKPMVLAFFALAAAMLVIPGKTGNIARRDAVLLGASIGLTIYFAFTPGFIVSGGGEATRLMIERSAELGIPYNNVYTAKDINFYMTPLNETTRFCESVHDKEFLRANADYLAFYHLPDESVVTSIAELCETPNFVEMNDRTIGVVCKIQK